LHGWGRAARRSAAGWRRRRVEGWLSGRLLRGLLWGLFNGPNLVSVSRVALPELDCVATAVSRVETLAKAGPRDPSISGNAPLLILSASASVELQQTTISLDPTRNLEAELIVL